MRTNIYKALFDLSDKIMFYEGVCGQRIPGVELGRASEVN